VRLSQVGQVPHRHRSIGLGTISKIGTAIAAEGTFGTGGAAMAEPLVPEELWEAIVPLLPRHKARPGKRGRPPVDDRACLTGIVFVLRSGIPWEMLPREMGCGSGVTCWRRLRYWQRRGVWKKLLHSLLERVGQEKGIDWEHCCVDSQTFRAVFGGS
jgi:transposase